MDVFIANKKVRLLPSKIIGSGGEADIFDIGGGEVAKIFKAPNHPDYSGNVEAQNAAGHRIKEHQDKLRAWPYGLPVSVVGPRQLVSDSRKTAIVGYTMEFLSGMEVLLKYGERKYRESYGVTGDAVVEIFRDLHEAVMSVHRKGVVIGDFNDLNILVDNLMKVHLVDADSMQFGGWKSRVFTARFVDPLLCDVNAHQAMLVKPHNEYGDWYSYAVMLMQSLLFVGPYGGVHAPSDVSKKLREWKRVQHRKTVFSNDVLYPKPALHYSVLPDDLLSMFDRIFQKDERGTFPQLLLENLKWTTCPLCKKVHARVTCPDCQITPVSMVKEIVTGSIEAMKILDTGGRIVYVTMQAGVLRYVYHQEGAYYREGVRKVLDGKLDPTIKFRVSKDITVLAKNGQCVAIEKDGSQKRFVADLFRGKVTVVDVNKDSLFSISGDSLFKFTTEAIEYAERLGTVLPSQSLVFVSDSLGFIFSSALGLTQSYVFKTSGTGIGKEVDIGRISGQILDATAVFSDSHVWFLMACDEGGKRINKVFMFDQYGNSCGQAETLADDGSWLSGIRGKCALGKQLFSPTDEGITRVEEVAGKLTATKVFSETTRFVDSASKLLFGKDGIYVVASGRIWRLKMK